MPDIKCLTNVFYYYYCSVSGKDKYGDISYLLLEALSQCLLKLLFLPLTLHIILLEPINLSLRSFWSFVLFIFITVFSYLSKTGDLRKQNRTSLGNSLINSYKSLHQRTCIIQRVMYPNPRHNLLGTYNSPCYIQIRASLSQYYWHFGWDFCWTGRGLPCILYNIQQYP